MIEKLVLAAFAITLAAFFIVLVQLWRTNARFNRAVGELEKLIKHVASENYSGRP
jgi:HAMP domain-containing protein